MSEIDFLIDLKLILKLNVLVRFPRRLEELYFAEIRLPSRFDFAKDLEFWANLRIDLICDPTLPYTSDAYLPVVV